VDRLFLQDDRVSYFSSEKEGAVIGIEAVREHHRGFGFVEGGKEQPNKLWVEELQTSAFGPTAVVTAIWFFQRPDGTVQRGPVTMVYVKVDKEFRIAHMHFANYLEKNKKEGSKS
jgi:ketosteroid isomerase-like protein